MFLGWIGRRGERDRHRFIRHGPHDSTRREVPSRRWSASPRSDARSGVTLQGEGDAGLLMPGTNPGRRLRRDLEVAGQAGGAAAPNAMQTFRRYRVGLQVERLSASPHA